MLKRIVIGLFASIFCGSAFAECYKADIGTCGIEASMLEATNAFRARNGLPPLQYKRELAWAARKWSDRMAETGQVGHDGFPTWRNQVILLEFPSSKMRAHGENVAYFRGHKPPDFGRFFVDLWIGSPGHRENILRNFRFVGMGYGRNNGGHFGTQLFAW